LLLVAVAVAVNHHVNVNDQVNDTDLAPHCVAKSWKWLVNL